MHSRHADDERPSLPPDTWGDGGGGSGASASWEDGSPGGAPGGDGVDGRKLVANELGSWISRQEQVVKELKQTQEQSLEQLRGTLESSLACHVRTLERLLVWYLDPQHRKNPQDHKIHKFSENSDEARGAPKIPSPSSTFAPVKEGSQESLASEVHPPTNVSGPVGPPPVLQPWVNSPHCPPGNAQLLESDVSGIENMEIAHLQSIEELTPVCPVAKTQAAAGKEESKSSGGDNAFGMKSSRSTGDINKESSPHKKVLLKSRTSQSDGDVHRKATKSHTSDGRFSIAHVRTSVANLGQQGVDFFRGSTNQSSTKPPAVQTSHRHSHKKDSHPHTHPVTFGQFSADLLSMAQKPATRVSGGFLSGVMAGTGQNHHHHQHHQHHHRNTSKSSTQSSEHRDQHSPAEAGNHPLSGGIAPKRLSAVARSSRQHGSRPSAGSQQVAPADTSTGESSTDGAATRSSRASRKSDRKSARQSAHKSDGVWIQPVPSQEMESVESMGPVGSDKSSTAKTVKHCVFKEDSDDEEDESDDSYSDSEESSGVSESEMPENKGRQREGQKTRRFSDFEKDLKAKNMSGTKADELEALMAAKEEEDDNASLLSKVVNHTRFDRFIAIVLMTNAILIGIQVDSGARNLTTKTSLEFLFVDTIYCVIFSIELAMRIAVFGPRHFFNSSSWHWNCFDFAVVLLQVLETLINFSTLNSERTVSTKNLLIFGRLARVARIVRVVRVIRVMRFFRAFRVLLTMIFGTMKNGAWAAVLMLLIMYVFAIVFTQATTEYLVSEAEHEVLKFYFGTVSRSILTLFKAIIGGIDWEIVATPLSDAGSLYVCVFLVYIIVVQLIVMNVVTGLFLQSAIEQAQADQEHVIQLRLSEKVKFVQRLHELFEELDSSHDGSISLDEFEEHLRNDRMQALIQTFEIDNADAWTLFKLLDSDGGGSVDIEEFVDGCIRLKGGAKSIQMAQVMYHHKWIMDKLVDLSDNLADSFRPLLKNQQVIHEKLEKLNNPDYDPREEAVPSLKRQRTVSEKQQSPIQQVQSGQRSMIKRMNTPGFMG